MPFLTKTDLTSIIYLEDIDVITEGDDTKVTTAINAGIGEAVSYLDRFNSDAMIAWTGDEREPIFMECCKAIALWYLIAACPANQNTKDIDSRATFSRSFLGKVQNGTRTPKGWPLATPPEQSTFFHVSSNPKRGNHY